MKCGSRVQREEKGGLWVRIATYPRAAAQLPGGLQGGGSPGLAVQGCGRDGTLLLLLFSAAAAERAQALVEARSAATAVRHCCLLPLQLAPVLGGA